jgi:hypothetical protein
MVRSSVRFVPYKDRKAVVAGVKKIYLASSAELAALAPDEFAGVRDTKYPMISNPKNEQCPYGIGGPPLINSQSSTGKTESPYDVPFTQNKLQALRSVLNSQLLFINSFFLISPLFQVFLYRVRGTGKACGALNFQRRHGTSLKTEHFTGPGKNRIPGNFEMDAFKAIGRFCPQIFHREYCNREKHKYKGECASLKIAGFTAMLTIQ